MRKRVALAQTLILDPEIILMDEPFSALDIQTRQLMENELLELWSADRKSVVFITHDLEEAISLSDRVVVLSAGPGVASDRRIRDRPAAAARRGRDPAHAALHRAAHDDLAGDEGRSAEELCAPARTNRFLRIWQLLMFAALFAVWHVVTSPTLLPPIYFDNPEQGGLLFRRAARRSLARIWIWFSSGSIYAHLWVTLVETDARLRHRHGARACGSGCGSRSARPPSALLDPYIKALNSMPRVILAPIFGVWFGLGIASKVALGVTLVFFIVFFNVYQGVREVSPTVLANARILGASDRQLLRHVYIPSAMSWVFASLHNSVGLAFVGAVVGEYLGSSRGVGYLILQAEGTFDINAVFAGILVLTAFALLLDWVVTIAERRLMVWQPRSGETERI